jgi:hypothetical protein
MYRFFEDTKDKEMYLIGQEFYNLVAGDDVARAYTRAKRWSEAEKSVVDLPTLSGILEVGGWAAWRLGTEEGLEESRKIAYLRESRRFLENALVTVLYPNYTRRDFIGSILRRVNEYLDEAENQELESTFLDRQSICIFHSLGIVEKGYRHYRLMQRLEMVQDSAEKANLLIMFGQSYLDMGWSQEKPKPKSAEQLACDCWEEVIAMAAEGDKVYPGQMLLAVLSILGNEPYISVSRAQGLYKRSQKLVASEQEKKQLENAFDAAIRRTEGPKQIGLHAFLLF